MMENKIYFQLSPFRVAFIFLMLVVGTIFILPSLKVNLFPSEESSRLTISFSMPNSSPDIVEQQITSIIEGACSQLKDVKKITSVSAYNSGSVVLIFAKGANMPFKEFELTLLIRQIYPKLPAAASYPSISQSGSGNKSDQNPLLVYSISGPMESFKLKQIADHFFKELFADVREVREINISGTGQLQISILFDRTKCEAWNIRPGQIMSSLNTRFSYAYPGSVITTSGEQYFLQLIPPKVTLEEIKNLLVSAPGLPDVRLRDISRVSFEEQESQSFFRINGKNSVTLSIYVREGSNKIEAAGKIKKLINQADARLPDGVEVRLKSDDTSFIEAEVNRNVRRAILSVSILSLFVILIYRNRRYLLILFSGMVASMCLTILLTWIFGVAIHLYSIAGLAIAFGIVTDNIILMLDYYHQRHDRKVFGVLLGASSTIIATLCLVFFLPENDVKNVMDFSIIIILALISSLITSVFLVPAVYELPPLFSFRKGNDKRTIRPSFPALRRVIGILRAYGYLMRFLGRHRKVFIGSIILGFGLPLFLLPSKVEGDKWYHDIYNTTIGSTLYQENIRPYTDKWLGGSCQLFISNVYSNSAFRDPEVTKLYIQAKLSNGTPASEMDHILSDFEKYLSGIEGVDTYITQISGGEYGSISISFKGDYANSPLPQQLKASLIRRSVDWDGVEWRIHGVGLGFSNAGSDETPGFLVQMKGYNYDELEQWANRLGERLSKYKRIQKINTNESMNFREGESSEYSLEFTPRIMALSTSNEDEILGKITDLSKPPGPSGSIAIDNQFYPVLIKEKQSDEYSVYDLLHQSLFLDSNRQIRVDNFGKLELHHTVDNLYKEDRQYIRLLSFEYLGNVQFGNEFLKNELDKIRMEMPSGFTVVQNSNWGDGADSGWNYQLIFLLIGMIFFIGSILFEDLRQPGCIISMIPVSFIGLFLIFTIGGFPFDQGGSAAFIMIGALVSNSAIFIVNDFNRAKRKKNLSCMQKNRILLKTTLNRARTVLLTTLTTCCGLIPFLLVGDSEVFWYSFAIGAIGGMLFSLFALLVTLPFMLWEK